MASLNLPKGRDLASEYSKTLSAQMNILPNLMAAQAQYQPIASANQLQNINQLLLGTPDLNWQSQVYTPSVYNQGGNYSYGKIPTGVSGTIQYPNLPDNIPQTGKTGSSGSPFGGGLFPGMGGLPGMGGGLPSFAPGVPGGMGISSWNAPGLMGPGSNGTLPGMKSLQVDSNGNLAPKSMDTSGLGGLPGVGSILDMFGGGPKVPKNLVSPSGYRTVDNSLPGQQGLLSLYENYIAPSQERITSGQRASDINDVGMLGPAALQAIMQSDPGTASLVNRLSDQAGSQLNMGSNLTPAMLRQAQQSVRARQTGMLGGTGSAGDLGEALGISQFGQGLYQQRLANAGSAIGTRQAVYGQPFQNILGRTSGTSTQGALGQAGGLAGAGPQNTFLNPQSSYSQDLYNTNYNSLVNGAIAQYNGQNALIGAGISAVGSLAGGALGGI